MPIYVFRCEECGEVFEALVSLSSRDKPQPCPNCGSSETRKQVASVNALTGSSKGASACGPSSSPFT